MLGCVTLFMVALVPYRHCSNRLMRSRPNWLWLRPRWCTSGWGRPRQCPPTGSATQVAQAVAAPLHLGSCVHKPSPFLTWTWWWIRLAWENHCGHASTLILEVKPSYSISKLIFVPHKNFIFIYISFSIPLLGRSNGGGGAGGGGGGERSSGGGRSPALVWNQILSVNLYML